MFFFGRIRTSVSSSNKALKVFHNRYLSTTSMTPKALDISGVFPPIPTPFDANEEIDYAALESNINMWNKTPIRGYLVQGSNGEYCYLTMEERLQMVKKVREFASKDKLVLAGSGCESTRQTIELTQAMGTIGGADAAVVVTPCYFKGRMTSEALKEHFIAVANSSPIPIILYSVPANTGLDLPAEVVIELSSHPNIIGMKDSGGDVAKIGKMVFGTLKENFNVLAGSASFLLPALGVGAVGGICALANVLPNEVCQVYQMHGRGENAMNLQHRLIHPNAAVTRIFGVAGLKKSMDWFGYYGGPTRRPLLPLTPKEEDALRAAFKTGGFL